jgi:hypothetical protein
MGCSFLAAHTSNTHQETRFASSNLTLMHFTQGPRVVPEYKLTLQLLNKCITYTHICNRVPKVANGTEQVNPVHSNILISQMWKCCCKTVSTISQITCCSREHNLYTVHGFTHISPVQNHVYQTQYYKSTSPLRGVVSLTAHMSNTLPP